MGNLFAQPLTPENVNEIFTNVKELEEIGIPIAKKYYTRDFIQLNDIMLENRIKKLYGSFYYPKQSSHLWLNEIAYNHEYLKIRLRKLIKLYNKYNSTNIDVYDYVNTTVKNLQPTLRVIGL